MDALERRGAALAEAARARSVARLARDLDALPGVRAEAAPEGVVLRGRGLARRALTDARLRWIAGGGR